MGRLLGDGLFVRVRLGLAAGVVVGAVLGDASVGSFGALLGGALGCVGVTVGDWLGGGVVLPVGEGEELELFDPDGLPADDGVGDDGVGRRRLVSAAPA